MKFALDGEARGFAIHSYSEGEVVIQDRVFRGSLALTPEQLLDQGFPNSTDALDEAHFKRLEALGPEVVLVGSGKRQRFPRMELYAPLLQRGVGVEVMSTPAACRTYNILLAEGRRVCALLILD